MGVETELRALAGVRGATAVDLSSTDFTVTGGGYRGIYVGGTGDVKVDLADNSTVTFAGLASGIEHAIVFTKIWKVGTTATGILALK